MAGNLSGGMKQKLGLACALAHTPRVLFLDEPTNGVDPVSRRDFWRILYQLLREKVTVFVSTAYLDEAERCGREGKLLAAGTPGDVKKLMRESIIEVSCVTPRDAARLIRDQLEGISVGLFGDRVHIVTSNAVTAAARVKNTLSAAGIEVFMIRPIEPSLEDVFVSVIGERSESGRQTADRKRQPEKNGKGCYKKTRP